MQKKTKKSVESIGRAENLDIEQKYYTAIIGIVAIVAIIGTTALIMNFKASQSAGLAYGAETPVLREQPSVIETATQVYCQRNLGQGIADPDGWHIDCSEIDCTDVKDSYENLGYICSIAEN